MTVHCSKTLKSKFHGTQLSCSRVAANEQTDRHGGANAVSCFTTDAPGIACTVAVSSLNKHSTYASHFVTPRCWLQAASRRVCRYRLSAAHRNRPENSRDLNPILNEYEAAAHAILGTKGQTGVICGSGTRRAEVTGERQLHNEELLDLLIKTRAY